MEVVNVHGAMEVAILFRWYKNVRNAVVLVFVQIVVELVELKSK